MGYQTKGIRRLRACYATTRSQGQKMKSKFKKTCNLADKHQLMKLLRQLYGIDEVKDDNTIDNTKRGAGAEGSSEVVKLPPNCS